MWYWALQLYTMGAVAGVGSASYPEPWLHDKKDDRDSRQKSQSHRSSHWFLFKVWQNKYACVECVSKSKTSHKAWLQYTIKEWQHVIFMPTWICNVVIRSLFIQMRRTRFYTLTNDQNSLQFMIHLNLNPPVWKFLVLNGENKLWPERISSGSEMLRAWRLHLMNDYHTIKLPLSCQPRFGDCTVR